MENLEQHDFRKHINIRYINDKIPRLKINEKGDWIDCYAAEEVMLKKGDSTIISLGFAMQLPVHSEAYLVARSSTFKNFGVIQTNGIGIIDGSYCGNDDIWGLPVLAMRDTVIHVGDKIAQMRIDWTMAGVYNGIVFHEVKDLGNENRGGFGSTGTR